MQPLGCTLVTLSQDELAECVCKCVYVQFILFFHYLQRCSRFGFN